MPKYQNISRIANNDVLRFFYFWFFLIYISDVQLDVLMKYLLNLCLTRAQKSCNGRDAYSTILKIN